MLYWLIIFFVAYARAKINVNFFCIDWYEYKKLAGREWYKHVAENAVRVGKKVGKRLIEELIRDALELPSRRTIHAVGFGYGAHMVGNAARYSDGKIGRITGLDPRRNWFQRSKHKQKMLKKSDAYLVDIIHSNGGRESVPGKSGFIGVVTFQNIICNS